MELLEGRLTERREQQYSLATDRALVIAFIYLRHHLAPILWEARVTNTTSLAYYHVPQALTAAGEYAFRPRPNGVFCFYERDSLGPTSVTDIQYTGRFGRPLWASVWPEQSYRVVFLRPTPIRYTFVLRFHTGQEQSVVYPAGTIGPVILAKFTARAWVSMSLVTASKADTWADFSSRVNLVSDTVTTTILTAGFIWGGNLGARSYYERYGVFTTATLLRQRAFVQATRAAYAAQPLLAQVLHPHYFGRSLAAPPVRQYNETFPIKIGFVGSELTQAVQLGSAQYVHVLPSVTQATRFQLPATMALAVNIEQQIAVSYQRQDMTPLLQLQLTPQPPVVAHLEGEEWEGAS